MLHCYSENKIMCHSVHKLLVHGAKSGCPPLGFSGSDINRCGSDSKQYSLDSSSSNFNVHRNCLGSC